MKWFSVLFTIAAFSISQASAGEAPAPVKPAAPPAAVDHAPKATVNISPGELTPTPEMWFYEQEMRQYQDPKNAVRQKAEFRSVERQRRLAAMKWYGVSNSRPSVGADIIHGDYGPTWASNRPGQPNVYTATPGVIVTR